MPPPVLLAALRPGMLRLAAAEADGVILNWLGADDVPQALAELGERRPGFEVVARIFVCPTEDAAYARALGRRLITSYLTVPAYAAFHRWLGREEAARPDVAGLGGRGPARRRRGRARRGGRRAGAARLAASSAAAQVRRYADAGVDVPVLALLPTPESPPVGAAALTALIARLGRGRRSALHEPDRPGGGDHRRGRRHRRGPGPPLRRRGRRRRGRGRPGRRRRRARSPTASARSPPPLALDVTDEEQVRALVADTEQRYGRIDLFCANAGVTTGGGIEVDDADWDRAWRVNVLAHVYAARAVLPGMLARGEGYLLHTCSAAGVLTSVGDAPYTATKHAAVGFAEWLADHLPGPGHPGQRALPAGGGHADARRRAGRRPPGRPGDRRRPARCSPPTRSPTRRSPGWPRSVS